MDGQEFKETDLRWMRADELRSRLGIKHAQFQRMHRSFGVPFEHRGDGKPGTPLWIYFPGWIDARIRFEVPTDAKPPDQDERLKLIKANREELRYHKDLEILLHVRDATRDVDLFAGSVRKGIEKLPPACQEIMLAAIDDAAKQWIREHGDGLQRADEEINRAKTGVVAADQGGTAQATADPPPVRRKVHHNAPKRPPRRRAV